jgi:transglutaminase-like putative cysteine protease
MERTGKFLTAELIGLLLVILALQTFSFGISSSLRNTDTQYFLWICFVAAVLSFGLSKGRSKAYQALAGIAALGVIGVWILGARLSTPLLNLGNAILSVVPHVIPSIREQLVIDTTGISEAWGVIAQASSALWARLQTWFVGLNRNVTINDALIRNMVWTLIMWLFAAWMGWYAGKRNAVASLLPSVLLLAAVTSYSEYKIESLWFLVTTLLVLMGVWNYRHQTQLWKTISADYSESIRYDITQAVAFLTLVIGLFAFITPSISWQDVRDFLRERNDNEIAEMTGVQEQLVSARPVNVQKPSLPRDHLLESGYAQSQKIVMTISTGELPPVANPSITTNAPRYYWRNVTYDEYVGSGWITGKTTSQSYSANTPLIPGLLNGYRLVHLNVDMVEPEGRLFWSGILFSADIPMTAAWRVKPQPDLFADQSSLLQADMFAIPSTATGYLAETYIPTATIQDLRSASTEYPDRITARYLKLPSSIPERVNNLAREITRGRTNPYDKAKAIESYLRTNYPYDLEIPAPPEGQDVADYFLFELKRGYCDYYATAMVVLARASGLPARFVSGYAPGGYDAPNAQYVIREMNAHSWAEIYFPEIGWIEFEPTGSQPEIELQESKLPIPAGQNNDSTAFQLLTRFRLIKLSVWILPMLWVFLMVVIYFTVIERWLYLRLAPVIAIERIYQRLYLMGRPLAGDRDHAETAYEFMQKLNNRIEEVKAGSRIKKMFMTAQRDVRLLTNTYQASLFREYQTNRNDIKLALQTWKHLRWRLILAKINLRIKNMRAKKTISSSNVQP